MPKQTAYLVVNAYDAESPTPVRLYDNRDAAERHAAHLNRHLGADEDDLDFEVWEEPVLSEFQP
jgi:hypothetical protein